MAAPRSRLERLIEAIGEENLPSKTRLPVQPVTEKENNNMNTIDKAALADASTDRPVTEKVTGTETTKDSTLTDPFEKLQSMDEFVQERSSLKDEAPWWDFKSTLPSKVPQRPCPVQGQGGNASGPAFASSDMTGGFDLDSRAGDPAPLGIDFAPFIAVTKFPYKFVDKQWMQPIASAIFDANKIYDREWDLYYVWSDYAPTAKPVTFIAEHQLLALLDEINLSFPEADIKLTEELRGDLVISFGDCPDLRPRRLGRCYSRAQYTAWTEDLALPKQGQITDDRALEAFRETVELATEISKNKSKAGKAKKQSGNAAYFHNMTKSLMQVQRFLGLLSNVDDKSLPDVSALSLSPIDYANPPPYAFEQDVIFIAFDCEAFEHPPRMITEIGVATLDTRDLKDRPPGNTGKDWQQFIRARHFRIVEYKHCVNRVFVRGAPDRFEFGTSEFVGKDAVIKEVAACFKPPYSGSKTVDLDEKRNIVLVGHDVSSDIEYLQQIGYNVLNSSNIIATVDTAHLSRAYTKDPNPRALGGILSDFDLQGWNLHNAGNDAVYMIWALLAMCVKTASDPPPA